MAAQAAIFAKQKSEQAQHAEATKRLETRKFVREILKRYDTNRDGGLKFEELRTFLLDLDPKRKGKGKRITDGEVKWVIQMATPERTEFSGDWVNGKYHLHGQELQTAAEVWMKYVASYDAVSEVFDRHCTDPEGLINQATVKLVMQELLGEAPSDDDVAFVVAECSMVVPGKLSKPGFITAMSLFEMDKASDCPHISREKLRTHYNDKLVDRQRITPKVPIEMLHGTGAFSSSVQLLATVQTTQTEPDEHLGQDQQSPPLIASRKKTTKSVSEDPAGLSPSPAPALAPAGGSSCCVLS